MNDQLAGVEQGTNIGGTNGKHFTDPQLHQKKESTFPSSSKSKNQQSRRQQLYLEAVTLAERLQEDNISSVHRLVEIFGLEFVSLKVAEALKLYSEAQVKGASAYEEGGTPVATGKSKPRSSGGVFFFLLRQHCLQLGIDWNGLRISPPSWYEHKSNNRKSAEEKSGSSTLVANESEAMASSSQHLSTMNPAQSVESSETAHQMATALPERLSNGAGAAAREKEKHSTASTQQIAVPVRNATKANSSPKQSPTIIEKAATNKEAEANSASRPTRLKATVVGSLLERPRPGPNGKEDLIELRFKAEMNSSLPKGLPNLGESKVIVWCTTKQFEKVLQQSQITPRTRFIVEGEPVPAVGADLNPFLRLICTRLTTVELEQTRHAN